MATAQEQKQELEELEVHVDGFTWAGDEEDEEARHPRMAVGVKCLILLGFSVADDFDGCEMLFSGVRLNFVARPNLL